MREGEKQFKNNNNINYHITWLIKPSKKNVKIPQLIFIHSLLI